MITNESQAMFEASGHGFVAQATVLFNLWRGNELRQTVPYMQASGWGEGGPEPVAN